MPSSYGLVDGYGVHFQEWLNSICPAYRGVLPSGVTIPDVYVNYNAYTGNFAKQFIQPLTIYAKGQTSIQDVLNVVNGIHNAIGDGGLLLHYEDMNIFICKGDPFYQDVTDVDETIKAGYVNLLVSIYYKER